MPGQIPENLQKSVAERLAFYDDLGIRLFYRDRHSEAVSQQEQSVESAESAARSTQTTYQEPTLQKSLPRPGLQKASSAPPSKIAPLPLPTVPAPSLFDASDKIVGDTLLRIREDLG